MPCVGGTTRGTALCLLSREHCTCAPQAPEHKTPQEPQGVDGMEIPGGATAINLRGRGLQRVPEQVWASAATMRKLDLSSNALSALPPGDLLACTALQV